MISPQPDPADLTRLKANAMAALARLGIARHADISQDEFEDILYDVVGPAIQAYADVIGQSPAVPAVVVDGGTMYVWVAGDGLLTIPLMPGLMGG